MMPAIVAVAENLETPGLSERALRLLATCCTAGAPREVVSTRVRLPSRSSIITDVVETPCSRNRPSWPIRPGTYGILLMASVSATIEKAEPEKMSRAGISVVLLRSAERQRAMMVRAASSPSAVVCSPPVMPAGQTSSAALTSARRMMATPSASAAAASTAS